MKMIPLQAQARSMEVSAKVLRREGKVPCNLYGNESKNTQLLCDYSELYRVYAKAGESVIVDLDVAGTKVPVLFHEVQFEPVTDAITHVDFYAVNMKKEIEAHIPIHFIGESELVKGGGVLVTVHDHLTVKCLPSNLPSALEADLSSLKEFSDALLVSDVIVPAGVVVEDDADMMIATVQETRKEAAASEESGDAEAKKPAEGGEKTAES